MDPAPRQSNEGQKNLTADGTDEHGFNAVFIRVDP
jgi:hypothetical protein